MGQSWGVVIGIWLFVMHAPPYVPCALAGLGSWAQRFKLRLSWLKGKTNSSEGVNFENDVLYANGVELQIPMR